jgi:catechol 2,3-dioxygenase-like lactoylglutathione lyase family enzyme
MFTQSAVFSGYSVANQQEALKFYGEILGCPVEDTAMGLRMTFSTGHTVFIYEKADHQPASFTILNFQVPDINIAVDQLSAAGVTMERYDDLPAPQDEKGVLRGKDAGYGPNIAWFKDPSGNILSILED